MVSQSHQLILAPSSNTSPSVSSSLLNHNLIAIIIPLLVPPLIVRIINVIIEALDPPILPASPTRNIFRHILDILNTIIPLPINVLRDVFNLLHFPAAPASHILRRVLDVLNPVVEFAIHVVACAVGVVVNALLIAIPILL